jgi:hypothetical protein
MRGSAPIHFHFESDGCACWFYLRRTRPRLFGPEERCSTDAAPQIAIIMLIFPAKLAQLMAESCHFHPFWAICDTYPDPHTELTAMTLRSQCLPRQGCARRLRAGREILLLPGLLSP